MCLLRLSNEMNDIDKAANHLNRNCAITTWQRGKSSENASGNGKAGRAKKKSKWKSVDDRTGNRSETQTRDKLSCSWKSEGQFAWKWKWKWKSLARQPVDAAYRCPTDVTSDAFVALVRDCLLCCL